VKVAESKISIASVEKTLQKQMEVLQKEKSDLACNRYHAVDCTSEKAARKTQLRKM
jgi:hypothetical protein